MKTAFIICALSLLFNNSFAEDINVLELTPREPCYKFMKLDNMKPLSNCSKMINGRLSSRYPKTVKFAKFCLIEKVDDSMNSKILLVGNYTELDKDSNRVIRPFKAIMPAPAYGQDLNFKFKEDKVKTSINYSFYESNLTIKQVTRLFKRKIRNFQLGCQNIYSL